MNTQTAISPDILRAILAIISLEDARRAPRPVKLPRPIYFTAKQ